MLQWGGAAWQPHWLHLSIDIWIQGILWHVAQANLGQGACLQTGYDTCLPKSLDVSPVQGCIGTIQSYQTICLEK